MPNSVTLVTAQAIGTGTLPNVIEASTVPRSGPASVISVTEGYANEIALTTDTDEIYRLKGPGGGAPTTLGSAPGKSVGVTAKQLAYMIPKTATIAMGASNKSGLITTKGNITTTGDFSFSPSFFYGIGNVSISTAGHCLFGVTDFDEETYGPGCGGFGTLPSNPGTTAYLAGPLRIEATKVEVAILSQRTTNATQTILYLKGTFLEWTAVESNAIYELKLFARKSGSPAASAVFERRWVFAEETIQGSVTTIGTDYQAASLSTTAVAVVHDTGNNFISVRVTGVAATTLDWCGFLTVTALPTVFSATT
jgi:hypothetical protein